MSNKEVDVEMVAKKRKEAVKVINANAKVELNRSAKKRKEAVKVANANAKKVVALDDNILHLGLSAVFIKNDTRYEIGTTIRGIDGLTQDDIRGMITSGCVIVPTKLCN